ncbi:unnamed protein product [Calicophoron daubneyi]|uniref:Cilia- and flagella-associated protein 44 n=1 Tax=Calicophoron daubneyi TaxID=300641 RepID=A0AAV2U152_CALDB
MSDEENTADQVEGRSNDSHSDDEVLAGEDTPARIDSNTGHTEEQNLALGAQYAEAEEEEESVLVEQSNISAQENNNRPVEDEDEKEQPQKDENRPQEVAEAAGATAPEGSAAATNAQDPDAVAAPSEGATAAEGGAETPAKEQAALEKHPKSADGKSSDGKPISIKTTGSKPGKGLESQVTESSFPEDKSSEFEVLAMALANKQAEEEEPEEPMDDLDADSESAEEVIKAKVEPKKEISPDFVYVLEEAVSKPYVSEESGIPLNLVNLYHSFGFDALRMENLELLDSETVCYVVGNYLEICNLTTDEKRYLRTLSGVGIGAFAVHPLKVVFAIAEKGSLPKTCIYRYPQLDLYRLLSEGTQREFSACRFSPDGEMLATVGSEPDYMLTLWEWRNEQIILRAKAFSQDVYRVAWSVDLTGILTTAGAGHIKFWKMADTFTGLKLQGKLGKFGKTELSDIEGFVILPDGKVLTGSAWGNLLVWEGDLIKVQISRKGKRPCHNGLIMQIVMDEGELMTVGRDGWIRTWDFETVDTAECLEENAIFELEPMNELQVGPKAKLMYMVKLSGTDTTAWYAQDGDGGIWKLDLSFSHTSLAPEMLMGFHSGAILDCVTSPFAYTAATIGIDGRICIYDLVKKKTIVCRRFPSGGSRLIWSPPTVDPKGKTLIAGFQDGVVRILHFGENPETDPTRKAKHFALIDLGQALKPHVKAVTAMAYDSTGRYFVTGSDDGTVFFFEVNSKMLTPIGFFNCEGPVVKVDWIPSVRKTPGEVLVYMKECYVIQVPCPTMGQVDQKDSFALTSLKPLGGSRLDSIKSRLIHDEESAEKLKRYEHEKKARLALRAARAEREPETEEEAQKLDEEEELIRQGLMAEIADWAPFQPPEASPMVHAELDVNNPKEFWVAMDGYDSGFLYKCSLGPAPVSAEEAIRREEEKRRAQEEAAKRHREDDDEDAEGQSRRASLAVVKKKTDEKRHVTLAERLDFIQPHGSARFYKNGDTTITYWKFTASGKRLIVGFKDGIVRVQLLERPFDPSSGRHAWLIRMHDNNRGGIVRIALTHDEKFLMSVAQDGTFFVYELMTEELQNKEIHEFRARIPSAYESQGTVDDISDPKAFSIEQSKQKTEYDNLMSMAEMKKAETRRKVAELRLRFKRLKEANEKLPERLRLGKKDFDLVPDIREDLIKDRSAKIDLVYRETAWMSEKYRIALEKLEHAFRTPLDFDRIVVRAFCSGHCVSSIRTDQLSSEHIQLKKMLIEAKAARDAEAAKKMKHVSEIEETVSAESKADLNRTTSETGAAQMKGARGLRIARKLHVLEEAQRRQTARRAQWETLRAMKPADDYEDPEDLKAIATAKEQMGDFKLKSSPNYVVPYTLNAFGAKVRMVELIEAVFNLQHEMNDRVYYLRNKKIHLIEALKKVDSRLQEIKDDLPKDEPIIRLIIPEPGADEHPEKEFAYTPEELMRFKHEVLEGSTGSADNTSNAMVPAQAKAATGPGLIFSEAIFPQSIHKREPEVTTETDSSGTDRLVIWLPVHCLAYSAYAVSLAASMSHCILKRPPTSGLVGLPVPHMLEVNKSTEMEFENLYVVNTSRRIRPDPMTFSLECKTPTLVGTDDVFSKGAPTSDGNSSDGDSQRQMVAIEDQDGTPSTYIEARSSESVPLEHITVDIEQRTQRELRALYEMNELINNAAQTVRCFDAELRLTRHARFMLDILLKRAELHQLTLHEEYVLLKEFEKSESVLSEKRHARAQERQELMDKINDFNVKIEGRKREIERLTQKEHLLQEEFKASLGEGHKFADFLTKVFKKRIKRKKQEAEEGGSDESGSSSSSSDDSDFDESDEESEDEDNVIDLDTCPFGCPIEDYDNTCAIRERRLDIEEEMAEEKKALEWLRRDQEGYLKKQRVVDSAFKQAQAELEAFQLEKQKKLNELSTVVILRLNQIQYHLNGIVPADLSGGLVFLRQNLNMLSRRIRGLEEEKKNQRREQRDAKDKHIMLQKHKKLFQKELEKMDTVCNDEMIEKFGKVDDIERMECVMVNPKLEELTTRMLIMQENFQKEEMQMDEEIRATRDACIDQLRTNTAYLTQMLALFDDEARLRNQLTKKQSSMLGFTDNADVTAELKEIERLTNIVKSQESEINLLSNELGLLHNSRLPTRRDETKPKKLRRNQ